MSRITRRRFLASSAAATAPLIALLGSAPAVRTAAAFVSKNDRPRLGCIGVGGRGMGISQWAAGFGDIVAVCDADLKHAEEAKAKLAPSADIYQNYKAVLDRADVDAVIHATPDHWHTKINIEACLAGKDIYAEKPLTLTIDEGKLLRQTVEKTGRIVQVGTMQRSEPQFQTAVELVRNGRIGKLQQVWVALPHYSTKGGPFATEPVPESLDWELYQGQAPVHPYTHYRCHGIFRWWYEYAGGIVTDWGNHHVDIAHWGMDCDLTGPTSVEARGIFPNEGRADCYNTPDRFFSRMMYPNGIEVLYFASLADRQIYGEVEPCAPTTPEQSEWLFGKDAPAEVVQFERNGIMFIGDKGRVFVNRGGIYGKPAEELAANPLPSDAWRVAPSRDHMENFFQCAAERRQPVAPVAVEHRTVSACHLTNISIRLGRKIQWDPEKELIVGDDEAAAMLSRSQRGPYTIEV